MPLFGQEARVDVITQQCREGETIEIGSVLATLGFGKWEFDILAPGSGTVISWMGHPGDMLMSGDTVAVMRVKGSVAAAPSTAFHGVPDAGKAVRSQDSGDSVFDDGFGIVERLPLSRIRRATAKRLQQSWSTVPQVTHVDPADITFAQAVLARLSSTSAPSVPSLLALVVRAVIDVLERHPEFAASFDQANASLLVKRYRSIGVATDTPNGLLVPVLRDVRAMTASMLTIEIRALAMKAREEKLSPGLLEGSCFTVSNLGSIGGEIFTPIVNPPDVAILGLGRAFERVMLRDGAFKAVSMLPLCLSYDHRAIDGAGAARFVTDIRSRLEDLNWIEGECARMPMLQIPIP